MSLITSITSDEAILKNIQKFIDTLNLMRDDRVAGVVGVVEERVYFEMLADSIRKGLNGKTISRLIMRPPPSIKRSPQISLRIFLAKKWGQLVEKTGYKGNDVNLEYMFTQKECEKTVMRIESVKEIGQDSELDRSNTPGNMLLIAVTPMVEIGISSLTPRLEPFVYLFYSKSRAHLPRQKRFVNSSARVYDHIDDVSNNEPELLDLFSFDPFVSAINAYLISNKRGVCTGEIPSEIFDAVFIARQEDSEIINQLIVSGPDGLFVADLRDLLDPCVKGASVPIPWTRVYESKPYSEFIKICNNGRDIIIYSIKPKGWYIKKVITFNLIINTEPSQTSRLEAVEKSNILAQARKVYTPEQLENHVTAATSNAP